MRQCTTRQANLQEVKIDKVRVAAVSGAVDLPKSYVDGDTGEVVAGLHDERFQWRTRKRQTLRLADLYKLGAIRPSGTKLCLALRHWSISQMQTAANGGCIGSTLVSLDYVRFVQQERQELWLYG